MSELVSVIIPCFNNGKYIGEAIDSVLGQTYTDWECIVINDGSTDNSSQIIQEYTKRDSRIRCLEQENAGVTDARNAGFLEAKGIYIQFLDGDDYLHPEKLERQVKFMNKNPAIDMVYSNHFHHYADKDITEKYYFTIINNLLQEVLFNWDRGFNIPIHTPLFKKCIWKGIDKPFESSYLDRYEDWVFWVKLGLMELNIAGIDENLAYYRIHGDNFTSKPSDKAIHAIKAMIYIQSIIPQQFQSAFIDQTLQYYFEDSYQSRINEEFLTTLSWKIGRRIAPVVYKLLPGFVRSRYKIRKV